MSLQCLVRDLWLDPTSFEKFNQSTQHQQKPTNNVSASEEFFLLINNSHILFVVFGIFGMTSLDDAPCSTYFPTCSSNLDSLLQQTLFLVAAENITNLVFNQFFLR